MDCGDARDRLPEFERNELSPEAASGVRAHLAACAGCREVAEADARLRALLRTRAPRFEAPPAVRRRVAEMLEAGAPRRWRDRPAWWVGLSVGLAAATVLLVWVGARWLRPDPVSQLVAEALHEHAEYVQEAMPRQTPDPRALLQAVGATVQFPVEPVFRGDAQVQLVAATGSQIRGRHAAALIYRSAAGIYSTLFLLPQDVPIPEGGRMAIQTYKPHHRVAEDRHLLLWKQRGLTYLLVSDLPEGELPGIFLKIRTAG
jgi:anti-sigma factor (TIGR02949 family)